MLPTILTGSPLPFASAPPLLANCSGSIQVSLCYKGTSRNKCLRQHATHGCKKKHVVASKTSLLLVATPYIRETKSCELPCRLPRRLPCMHDCMEWKRCASFAAIWLSRQWEVKPCRSEMVGGGGGHVRIGEVDGSHVSFGGPAGYGS